MKGFAADTDVAPEKTRAEIERTVSRYGADQFATAWEAGRRAVIGFRCKVGKDEFRFVKFVLPLPDPLDNKFARDGRGSLRSPDKRREAAGQAERAAWRRLLLCIRAKLETVATGIETFEEAFLAHIVVPGSQGATVGDWLKPQLAESYRTGVGPSGLLAITGG